MAYQPWILADYLTFLYMLALSNLNRYLTVFWFPIFLSTCGENEAEVPKELVDFLKHVKNPGESLETQYMMLEEMLKEEREAGRKEGHEAGKCINESGKI